MDCETYLSGRESLKMTIKTMSAEQSRDKAILRIPRKTKDNWSAIDDAVGKAGYLSGTTLGAIQAKCWFRRQKITAYLSVYAEIRKRPTAHLCGRDYDELAYSQYLTEARLLFESASNRAVAL